MPEIREKMAAELQNSLLLQEESFFNFTDAPLNNDDAPPNNDFTDKTISNDCNDAPLSNGPVTLSDNVNDNSLLSQRDLDDNASEITEFSDSDSQFDTCSDKENSEVTDFASKEICEVGYQKACVNSSDITANHKAYSWNELQK